MDANQVDLWVKIGAANALGEVCKLLRANGHTDAAHEVLMQWEALQAKARIGRAHQEAA